MGALKLADASFLHLNYANLILCAKTEMSNSGDEKCQRHGFFGEMKDPLALTQKTNKEFFLPSPLELSLPFQTAD